MCFSNTDISFWWMLEATAAFRRREAKFKPD